MRKKSDTEIHEFNKKKKIHYRSSHRRPPTMEMNKKTGVKKEKKKKLRQISNSCAPRSLRPVLLRFLCSLNSFYVNCEVEMAGRGGMGRMDPATKLCILYIRMYNLLYLFYCVCNAIFQFGRRRTRKTKIKTHILRDDGPGGKQRAQRTRA